SPSPLSSHHREVMTEESLRVHIDRNAVRPLVRLYAELGEARKGTTCGLNGNEPGAVAANLRFEEDGRRERIVKRDFRSNLEPDLSHTGNHAKRPAGGCEPRSALRGLELAAHRHLESDRSKSRRAGMKHHGSRQRVRHGIPLASAGSMTMAAGED